MQIISGQDEVTGKLTEINMDVVSLFLIMSIVYEDICEITVLSNGKIDDRVAAIVVHV